MARDDIGDAAHDLRRKPKVSPEGDEPSAMSAITVARPADPWRTGDRAVPGGGGVLVVEDDPCVAALLRVLLQTAGAHVQVAGDATEGEALFHAQAGSLALVIVDCSLRDVNVADLCARWRSASPGLPILLTSGRDQLALVEQVKAGGPTGFLGKPFARRDLTVAVSALVAVPAAA